MSSDVPRVVDVPRVDTSTATDVPTEKDTPTAEDTPSAREDAAEPDAGARTQTRGTLTVQVFPLSGGWLHSVSVELGTYAAPACQERSIGPCQVRRCRSASREEFEEQAVERRSAGALSMTVGDLMQTQSPSSSAQYEGIFGSGAAPRWRPGDAVRFEFAGDALGAFTAATTFPAQVDATLGDVDAGARTPLSRARPLAVRWTSMGDGGAVVVQLAQSDFNALYPRNSLRITCSFDRSAGQAAIPMEALSELAVDPTGNTSVTVCSEARVEAMAGTLPVALLARNFTREKLQVAVE